MIPIQWIEGYHLSQIAIAPINYWKVVNILISKGSTVMVKLLQYMRDLCYYDAV